MWWHTVMGGRGSEGETGEWSGKLIPFTLTRNMVYPALLPLMRTSRLPVVDWNDAPADWNGLVRFAERRNLVSARVPSHFNWPLLLGNHAAFPYGLTSRPGFATSLLVTEKETTQNLRDCTSDISVRMKMKWHFYNAEWGNEKDAIDCGSGAELELLYTKRGEVKIKIC